MAFAHQRTLQRATAVLMLSLAASACSDLATSPLPRESERGLVAAAPSSQVVVYDFQDLSYAGLSQSFGNYPFPSTYLDLRIQGGTVRNGQTQMSVTTWITGGGYLGPTTKALNPEHMSLQAGAPVPPVVFVLPRPASSVSIDVLYYNGHNIAHGRGGEAAFLAYGEDGTVIGRVDVPRTVQMNRFETLTLRGPIFSVGIISAQYTASWNNLVVSYGAFDTTAPQITPTIGGTLGQNGWYTSDVSVAWSVADAESPVTSAPCPASALTADTVGATFACTATSGGGTATASLTVNRDATAPVIAFTGNAGSYTLDQQVAITCTATDATSGIATRVCPGASGAGYTFAEANTLRASATDQAGNESAAQASFTVEVAPAGLAAVTQQLVSDAGLAGALGAKLSAVADARARGNDKAAAGQIAAFINQVQAQRGKKISAQNADTLIRLAQRL